MIPVHKASSLYSASDVFMFVGTAHCANMYPPSDQDSPQLRAARTKIAQLITGWLKA